MFKTIIIPIYSVIPKEKKLKVFWNAIWLSEKDQLLIIMSLLHLYQSGRLGNDVTNKPPTNLRKVYFLLTPCNHRSSIEYR